MASRGPVETREDVIALIMGAWPTQVIAEAGLRLDRVVPTGTDFAILECRRDVG